ncbi:hypothetical protein [Fictibacillus norfolkensis]|uniref:Type 4 fimbrial biogenesis protein PilX N-terminal domain-containing protein n=1 Tax=Fictibacillus norfolkensis TaxID=2762233 RepID=A0ABR8SIC3_9BACL|nr:hypothetical protein [Fictibacillus norfolkensis]MBD7963133.1 hypothetical protein [Fictibacillus norfolkensis]
MKYVKSDRGNTLIIVLLMIVIFTIAGLSLISTTFNGVKKTDARETDIKSVELAEKGIDYLTILLETKSKNFINLPTSDFNIALTNLLQNYEVGSATAEFKPTSVIPTENNADTLKVKIYDRYKLTDNIEDLTQVMTLHSEATVNGKKKTLISTIKLGGKQTPEALDYALGSYNPQSSTNPDDGNMFLHGGVSINGDLYVEGNLITRDQGFSIENGRERWIPSDFPSIEGADGKKAHLILHKKLYTLDKTRPYYDHINETNFNKITYYSEVNTENVKNAFADYSKVGRDFIPTVKKTNPNFTPINILGEKGKYYFTNTSGSISPVTTVTNCSFIVRRGITPCPGTPSSNIYANLSSTYFDGSYTLKRLSTKSDARFYNSVNNQWNKLTFTQGAYIGGNLTIGDTSDVNGGYNKDYYQKFEIDGPLFIDGDLTLRNAYVKFNSIVYVTGKTNIQYSRLEGIQKTTNTPETSLILFGKKDIHIANNNVYKDTPNVVRGFFYSEDLMEIYGVASNVEIQGGVFGRKVVLNATRGEVNSTWLGIDYANNQKSISPDDSRLTIIYNPELIRNPPEGLPTVTELSVTKINRYLK